MCSLNCPPFTVTPFPAMNVGTFKLLNKTTNSCQQTIHEKQPTHPSTTHSKRKHFQNMFTTHLSRHHTLKKQKYSNIKTLNKKLNRETPKKSFFFIKNPIKDKPLLHNHKPQTKIICQRKIKPLNDQKTSFPIKNP